MKLRWKIMTVATTSLLWVGLLWCGGCTNYDANEWQRLVVEVSAINGGQPLVSGYVDAGPDRRFPTEDDVLTIDFVTVTFHARPYNELIVMPEDTPFSYFHVTEYDLIWTPLTPGAEELVNFNLVKAPTDLLVPVGEDATVSVLVADRYLKEQTFFHDLAPSGDPYFGADKLPFQASCQLRFRGHETGSDKEIEVTGSFMVSFVGVVISE